MLSACLAYGDLNLLLIRIYVVSFIRFKFIKLLVGFGILIMAFVLLEQTFIFK